MSFYFTTNKNLLKRDTSSGTATIDAPATASGYGTFVTSYTVNHNLGYIPLVRAYYEPVDNGEIYPVSGYRIGGTNIGIAVNGVIAFMEISTTQLTIRLESNTSKTGTREIYWVIYKDSP